MSGAELLLIGAAVAASAAGTAISAISSSNQAKFQQAVEKHNALAASNQSAAEETRLRRDRLRRIGLARAQFGAAGVSLEGTPLEVLAEQSMEAEEDALLVRYGGKMQSAEHRARAKSYGQTARSSLIGGGLSMAGTLLGGASALSSAGAFSFGGGSPAGVSGSMGTGALPDTANSFSFALA